ncbi:MAG: hypothetical protein ABJP70_01850 [Erythrobacter sp.]
MQNSGNLGAIAMFLYGGIGLLIGGLILLLFSNSVVKDAEKAANARKQAPYLMLVGAVFLAIWVFASGVLSS